MATSLHICFHNVLFQKGVICSFTFFFSNITFSLMEQMDKKIVFRQMLQSGMIKRNYFNLLKWPNKACALNKRRLISAIFFSFAMLMTLFLSSI